MICLCIDTSNSYLSLALENNGQVSAVHMAAGQKHAELILPQLHSLLAEAKLSLSDLDIIAYAQGPGSFTGLRIGVGVAQGIGFAHNIKLVGIPNLDVLASLAPAHNRVLCATDARMNEVFFAWYNTKTSERLSDYQVGKPAEILNEYSDAIGVGNAFSLYPNELPVKGNPLMPTAEDYLPLVKRGIYPFVSADEAELLYVRNKVALTAKEQAMQRSVL